MLEYVFFHDSFKKRFLARLDREGLAHEETVDPIEGAAVIRIEEPDDALWDSLDDFYDELSDADQAEMESGSGDSMSTAGIYIALQDGRQTVAKIRPDVMNRMLSVISMDEFNEFVETIVKSVEEPDDTPICKTPVE